jgi:hypothetical protein
MAKRFSIIVLLVLIGEVCFSQSFYSVRRDRTLIFSAGTGTSTYFGELQNPGDFIDAKPNLNVGLQYFVTPQIAVRAEANWFQLGGDDKKADGGGREFRNLSFRSNNYEIVLTGAVSLFPKGNRYYQRKVFNPYAFVGVGYLYSNPKAELNGVWYPLQPLMTEDVKYSRSQFVIPYGLGARLKVGPFFNFVVEGGYRMTFTDYLDDVSTVHVDKSSWTDPLRIALADRGPEVGASPRPIGSIRGNPDTNDGYMLFNVKVEYYLPTNFIFKNSSSRNIYKAKRRSTRRRR